MNSENESNSDDDLMFADDFHYSPLRTSASQQQERVKQASRSQIDLVRKLTAQLGLRLSETQALEMRKMPWADVSRRIDKLEVEVATAGPLSARQAVGQMASNKAVKYLLELRAKALNSPHGEERLRIWAASKSEIHEMTQLAMKALAAYNDSHGVPVSAWRVERDIYDPAVLARNGWTERKRP